MLFGMNRLHHAEILSKIAHLVDQGQVRPLLDAKSFTFADVAAAHAYSGSGAAVGKVVLEQSFRTA
jgi:NADPH2:quinone reductase